MLHHLHLVLVTAFGLASCVDLEQLENELEKTFDLNLLKDYFRFHLFVNPRPICALEDEPCTLDNNCCRGLECKMAADRQGVRYSCQPSVGANMTFDNTGEVTNEEDVRWTIAGGADGTSDESSNSLLKEIIRGRLEKKQLEERRLLNDQKYLIQELQKPLNLDEMRDLQQMKELEDYHREKEIKELREWKKNMQLEEARKVEEKKKMEEIAKERVDKVLKEEKRQKLEILNKIQEAIKEDLKQ